MGVIMYPKREVEQVTIRELLLEILEVMFAHAHFGVYIIYAFARVKYSEGVFIWG